MGIYARNIDDVRDAIQSVPADGGIFVIPLMDNGSSHRRVLEFFEDRGEFMDSLSAHSGVFTIMVSRRFEEYVDPPGWLYEERPMTLQELQQLETLKKATYFRNPSGAIAKLFGIAPKALPGVLFFSALPDERVKNPVYVRLELDYFSDPEIVEHIIRELYSDVFEASKKSSDTGQFLDRLRSKLTARRRKEKLAPILSAIGERLEPVTRIPEKFVDAVIETTVATGKLPW